MESLIILIPTIIFALLLFPIHIYNYIYVNTEEGYASLNICIFRYFNVRNINTVKFNPSEIDVNGKRKKADYSKRLKIAKISANRIFIDKIIQLSDYGMLNENNAYLAVAQNATTNAFYRYLKKLPNIKLKNYIFFNNAHSSIRYYAKAVTIVNALTVLQVAIKLLGED
ncbi:MAG: hypothetical protein E7370_01395 [Clostridiales bacterium]|nr:hypothetical protein [Clostridiales bacterium]